MALAAALSTACESEPREVFVPASGQSASLTVRASVTEAGVGEPVVLHAARRSSGSWRLVEKASLAQDACWMAVRPPAEEPEVADNVLWEASPSTPARFNMGMREDHTREVVFQAPGTYTLTPTSHVWCGPAIRGASLTIVVRSK
jgi:hypothetical protein